MLVWPYRGAQYNINTSATATTEPTYERNAGDKITEGNQKKKEEGKNQKSERSITKINKGISSIPGCVANTQIS